MAEASLLLLMVLIKAMELSLMIMAVMEM